MCADLQGLETCLKETLVQALKENTYTDICDLLDITDETVVDFKLFSGVAAIIERILYPFYTSVFLLRHLPFLFLPVSISLKAFTLSTRQYF